MTEPHPPDGGADDDGLDVAAFLTAIRDRLYPFNLGWEEARRDLAADAAVDGRGVHAEWQVLSEPLRDDRDPDPTGLLGAVLARLQRAAGPAEKVWCGPGWHRLIAETDRRLADLAPDYRLEQVKEKFGTLRYYTRIPRDGSMTEAEQEQFRAVLQGAETASGFLCEVCGRADASMRGRGRGRLRTLCDTHDGWGTR